MAIKWLTADMSALLRQNEHVNKKFLKTWVHSEFELLNIRI